MIARCGLPWLWRIMSCRTPPKLAMVPHETPVALLAISRSPKWFSMGASLSQGPRNRGSFADKLLPPGVEGSVLVRWGPCFLLPRWPAGRECGRGIETRGRTAPARRAGNIRPDKRARKDESRLGRWQSAARFAAAESAAATVGA